VALAAATVAAGIAAPPARADGTLAISTLDSGTQAPVTTCCVTVVRWATSPENRIVVGSPLCDPDSQTYSLSLPAGQYTFEVQDNSGTYLPQWWGDGGGYDENGAQPVTVTDGQTSTCTVEMALAGHLTGTVTDTAGDPITGVYIIVRGGDYLGQTHTDASGNYDVGGLGTGSYTVEAQDQSANGLSPSGRYLYQFYPDQRSEVGATPFSVVAGQTSPGPTVVMKLEATISGSLTTHAGVVPHDVMCAVDRQNDDGTWTDNYVGSDCNNDCTYTIGQLPPGHYRLWFRWDFSSDPRNLPQYYDGTYWPDQAVQFDLTEGEHLTGMDAVIWGDDHGPVTLAPLAATVMQGATAHLHYEVSQSGRHGPDAAVTIEIKNRAGKVVKAIRIARSAVNRRHICCYACALPKGRYRFCIFAIDSGGNRQVRIGSNRLTVR
jgi:hypothetical protein